MRAFTFTVGLILLATQIFAVPRPQESADPPPDITQNKLIQVEDSDEKDSKESAETQDSSSTTQNPTTSSDLELSHSDLVESKVAKEPAAAAATAKDEKLGTADNFPIGFASPNLLPYDAPLISGSYAGDFGPAAGLGLNAPYNGFAGRGLYYGGRGSLLGNPLLGAGRGIGYGGGYADLALEELARQRLLLNKERQLRFQEEIQLQRSGKLLDGPYGGRNPYGGGVGYGDAELDAYGGRGYEDIAIQKGTGIDAYPDVDELAYKGLGPTGGAFGRSQYPINLNPRFNPYQNLGLGLNGYNQRGFGGGVGGLGGFNQFGSQGLEYQNYLAQQALLAKRKGALGRGYQPDPLLDPAYSQNYDAIQQPKPVRDPAAVAEKPKGKSPYGFYSGSS